MVVVQYCQCIRRIHTVPLGNPKAIQLNDCVFTFSVQLSFIIEIILRYLIMLAL